VTLLVSWRSFDAGEGYLQQAQVKLEVIGLR